MPSCIFTKSGGGGGGDVGALTAPTDLSGLVVWFDFSDSTKIFDSNTGGSTPANGGAIGRIEDKSSNARNATQATANNRPLYQTNVQNGLSVARFDGSNDVLITANFSMPAQASFFAVCARPWSTAAYKSIFSSANYAETTGYAFSISLQAGLNFKTRDIFYAARGFGIGRAPRIGGDGTKLNGFTSNSFHIISGAIGSSNISLFVDKVKSSLSGLIQDVDTGNDTTSTGFSIGGGTVGGAWDRDIGEIFVYDSDLSDTNRQKAENYLATKWGIA